MAFHLKIHAALPTATVVGLQGVGSKIPRAHFVQQFGDHIEQSIALDLHGAAPFAVASAEGLKVIAQVTHADIPATHGHSTTCEGGATQWYA